MDNGIIDEIEKISKISMLNLKLNLKIQNEQFIGEVYYYDEAAKLLILKENLYSDANSGFNLRYVNLTQVEEFKILSREPIQN